MIVREKLELVQTRYENQSILLKDSTVAGVLEQYIDITEMSVDSTLLSEKLTQSSEAAEE